MFQFQLLHLRKEVCAMHIHYWSACVPKEWMKVCFLGKDLCFFLEYSYDNLLFVLNWTIRMVLYAVCKLSDDIIHTFYWKEIDQWIIQGASFLSSIEEDTSKWFQCGSHPCLLWLLFLTMTVTTDTTVNSGPRSEFQLSEEMSVLQWLIPGQLLFMSLTKIPTCLP